MTVKDLINQLQGYEQDRVVIIKSSEVPFTPTKVTLWVNGKVWIR